MKNNVFYLSTCSTCKRIINEVNLAEDFPKQNIKTEVITKNQLEELKELAGSYEKLFSRRAQLYRKRNLKEKKLTEADYKNLILEHYTFLKRPVFVVDDEIFIGSAKKNVAALKEKLNN